MITEKDPHKSDPEYKQAYPILVGKVDLGELFRDKLERLLGMAYPSIPITVHADRDIVLFDQSLQPNRKGVFLPYEEKEIADGHPEIVWSQLLTKAIFHATENGISDREGAWFRLVPPVIAITARTARDIMINQVNDNGQGMLEEIFSNLKPGYDQGHSLKGKGRQGGVGLRAMYEEIEQIGGVVEIDTKRFEDVGVENSGTSVHFIFSVGTSSESVGDQGIEPCTSRSQTERPTDELVSGLAYFITIDG